MGILRHVMQQSYLPAKYITQTNKKKKICSATADMLLEHSVNFTTEYELRGSYFFLTF